MSFAFSLIVFSFDFQMRKTHLKSFVFEILFIGDYSSTFYLVLMAKFEVYNLFSFQIRTFRKWHTFLPRHLVYRYINFNWKLTGNFRYFEKKLKGLGRFFIFLSRKCYFGRLPVMITTMFYSLTIIVYSRKKNQIAVLYVVR